MKGIVLITDFDSSFSENLALVFSREDYCVFAIAEKLPVVCQQKDIAKNITLLSNDLDKALDVLKKEINSIDFLLDTTDFRDLEDNFSLRDGIKAHVIEKIYRNNILRSMGMLEAFLPLLDAGKTKRLFYITRAEASINETRLTRRFGYNMTKAALHQFLKMIRNKLTTRGYTFRVFDPMDREVTPLAAAESAFNYIVRRRGIENNDPLRDDETNLVFRDAQGRTHSW